MAPALIGADPRNLNHIHRCLGSSLRGHDYAKSALDIACWDITGQAAGLPLHAMIGGKRSGRLPLYQSITCVAPEEMARTFNCGVGMVIAVAADEADKVAERLETIGETVVRVGTIEGGERGCTVRGSEETWAASEAWKAVHLG